MFLEKIEIVFFLQNCFAYISATKYRSEAVLYSKRTAGYPLSLHIKTIAIAFFYELSSKATKKPYFEYFAKTPNFGGAVHTHIRVRPFIFCSRKDRLRLIRMHVNFQQPNQFMKFILSHLDRIIFNQSEGGWEGQISLCHIFKREYLVNILIMHVRHFNFHFKERKWKCHSYIIKILTRYSLLRKYWLNDSLIQVQNKI